MNEVISTQKFQMHSNLEELLEKIRKVIVDKNGWIERKEICNVLNLPLNTQLIEDMRNSKIGQLLYNYIRREDFVYQKVQLDPEDKYQYEIWICADCRAELPFRRHEVDLNEILQKLHGENYTIAESKQKVSKRVAKPPEIEEENDGDNENLNKITDLINQGENLFITGYAGTGKSYILNKLKKKFQIDVTSTTGLAAVNVQGQTIHSWAGIGICNKPVKDVIEKILQRTKLKKQISECKILAIDEISMLDAKTFDYIDEVLRTCVTEASLSVEFRFCFLEIFFSFRLLKKKAGFVLTAKLGKHWI